MKNFGVAVLTALASCTVLAQEVRCVGAGVDAGSQKAQSVELQKFSGNTLSLGGNIQYFSFDVGVSEQKPTQLIMKIINNDGDLDSSIVVSTKALEDGVTLTKSHGDETITLTCVYTKI